MQSTAVCMSRGRQYLPGDSDETGTGISLWCGMLLRFFGGLRVLAGFVGDFATPTRLDGQPSGPLIEGLLIDVLLIAAFGLQHSVMARPSFKRLWTQWVPWPVERSTYVLMTNLVLMVLFWQWRPLGGQVWEISQPAVRAVVWGLFTFGWLALW